MNAIVTFIDLIGISDLLGNGRADEAVLKMEAMHNCVYGAGTNGMPIHDHLYYWNDSVLLYAEIRDGVNTEDILKEADGLKVAIDDICQSYAISMVASPLKKPHPYSGYVISNSNQHEIKTVFLKPSSIAFANCFIVERELGKKHKKPWYVERALTEYISSDQSYVDDSANCYPDNTNISIRIYDGYLWGDKLKSKP